MKHSRIFLGDLFIQLFNTCIYQLRLSFHCTASIPLEKLHRSLSCYHMNIITTSECYNFSVFSIEKFQKYPFVNKFGPVDFIKTNFWCCILQTPPNWHFGIDILFLMELKEILISSACKKYNKRDIYKDVKSWNQWQCMMDSKLINWTAVESKPEVINVIKSFQFKKFLVSVVRSQR